MFFKFGFSFTLLMQTFFTVCCDSYKVRTQVLKLALIWNIISKSFQQNFIPSFTTERTAINSYSCDNKTFPIGLVSPLSLE